MPSTETFERRTRIPAPAAEVFAWHLRDGAFERLLPPGDGTRVVERSGELERDTMRVVLSVPVLGPVRQRWHVRHEGFRAGERFVDVMERGPFRSWRHEHRVEPIDGTSCELVDHVEYALPGGALGRLVGGPIVRRRLEPMFEHRHAVTRDDIAAHGAANLQPLQVQLARRWDDERLQQQVAALLSTGGHDVASPRPLAGSSMVREHPATQVVVEPGGSGRLVVRAGDEQVPVELTGDATRDPRAVLGVIAAMQHAR